jgi:hypothetical protein
VPIEYSLDPAAGVVTAVLGPSVSVDDMRGFLRAVATDPGHADTDPMIVLTATVNADPVNLEDTRAMIAELRALKQHFRGPIAVVAPLDSVYWSSRVAATLCGLAGFSLGVFRNRGDATKWLIERTAPT